MSERRKSPVEPDPVPAHMCSTALRLAILGRTPFFAGLPRRDLETINQRFREQGYQAGEPIYHAGDPAEHLLIVADGQVKLLRHALGGKEVLLDLLAQGEFFGSLSVLEEDFYADTSISQTSACILAAPRLVFREILTEYPQAAIKALEITSERLKAAHEMIRQLSAYPAEQRIAYILLKLGEKLGRPDETGWLIETPLSRDDLAQMSGTTTETASRVMSQFLKAGLVESGRQWTAIRDIEGLQKIVESRD